ncbi:exosortase A [Sulfurirhabdus autotrophica]|uniref:Exosortase A n=1 Tax=Sulfurirhabdus autotrophica TaxID=1706046 RepID=A0A4R3Y983_9PROT|nr:exosortase A [Sulfurirhabdus autotrophica]TCV88151.1 exosortase A [Sulfurirhabdus autotrophica]
MAATDQPVLSASATGNPAGESGKQWQLAVFLTLLTIAAILYLYKETGLSTVAIWERSETFAHGFLIFPISAYLVWTRRNLLAQLTPHPDYRGLFVIAALGLGWLIADAGSVLVLTQYGLVAMIAATVWTILGPQVARAIAFPLGFLLFAVPAGEFLIPSMMNFTADFVVGALQITGIPVFREGTFFTIPSGQWSVVEGCSGLRYLIASFTLGTLYAYLTFRSTKRRIIFSILSIIVPVFANGMRAYLIVMIAHLSDMTLALGVDHYIYGWVFFGIVMMLLFWIGSFWREDLIAEPEKNITTETPSAPSTTGRNFIITGAVLFIIAAIWPAYATYLDNRPIKTKGLVMSLPDSINGWQKQNVPISNWQPHFVGADSQILQTYKKGENTIELHLFYYRTQRQDAELINSQNYMVQQKHPVWNNVGEEPREVTLDGKKTVVQESLLRSPSTRLIVWSWNNLASTYTIDPYLAKLLLAKARLFGQHDDGAAIIVASQYSDDKEDAAKALQHFILDTLPAIQQSIHNVSEQ